MFTWGLLGTSLSHGATRDNSYARDVSAKLTSVKSSDVLCFNMSVDGGSSSTGGIPNYPSLSSLKPNAIILEYQMNDCVGSLDDSRIRHIEIISGIRSISPNSKIFLMIMNHVFGSSSPVQSRSNLDVFYQMYRDLSKSQSVGLIDNSSFWVGATTTDIPDGMHPTIAAHRARTVPHVVSALAGLVE